MGFWGTDETALPGNQQSRKNGGGFDNVINKSNDVLGTVNKVLCTINPNRPGCAPPISETTIIQQQRQNTWITISLVAVIAVMLVLLIRKK